MQIVSVLVSNFRSFYEAKVFFNKNLNFIIGKNNIGKTNFIDLMNIVFSHNNFDFSDFNDPKKNIHGELILKLEDDEIGLFDDLFSPENKNQIVVDFIQNTPDDELVFQHKDTNIPVQRRRLNRINFIRYTSNRKSVKSNELTLSKRKFLLIPNLIDKYMEENKESNNKIKIDESLLDYVNKNISYIKSFKNNNVELQISDNEQENIKRIVKLADHNGIDFSELGYGVQFASMFTLELLDNLTRILKFNPKEKYIEKNNKKFLRVVVAIDEPELHLHPNMQRKLIKDICNILEGNDDDFNTLLKELFNIDALEGQLLVVTHSPNILSSNYQLICRAYKNNEGYTEFASGNKINFSPNEEKQLISEIDSFKEAMFADKVILCEGQTEQTALPIFAKTLGIDLIDNNTNIVVAHGIKNVNKFIKIFEKLMIPCWAILDNDDNNRYNRKYQEFKNVVFTEEKDFENECYEVMTLDEIINFYQEYNEFIIESKGELKTMWYSMLSANQQKKLREKSLKNFILELDNTEKRDLKLKAKDAFMRNNSLFKDKSTLTGELIAKNISNVPRCYQKILKEIVE